MTGGLLTVNSILKPGMEFDVPLSGSWLFRFSKFQISVLAKFPPKKPGSKLGSRPPVLRARSGSRDSS